MISDTTNPSLCALIVSYNFEPWIDRCLHSLLTSTLPVTTVVVDNGSDDNTCEIIRSRYPEVVLIKSEENLGFGKANNIGFRYALEKGFDYLFLMNQDARIEPDTLTLLVAVAEGDKSYGVLSPLHLNSRGDATDFGFADYTGIRDRRDAERLSSTVTEFKFINAALWLVPTRIIREVGGFAPLFAHYGEDRNFVLRLQKKGYRLGLVKNAVGYHERENRELSRAQFFYSEFVYFLTEASNPYYNGIRAFAYSVMAALKKAAKALIAGKGKDAASYTSIALRLAGKMRAADYTRRVGYPMQK